MGSFNTEGMNKLSNWYSLKIIPTLFFILDGAFLIACIFVGIIASCDAVTRRDIRVDLVRTEGGTKVEATFDLDNPNQGRRELSDEFRLCDKDEANWHGQTTRYEVVQWLR